MSAKARADYVNSILAQYVRLPGTLHRVLRHDRRTATALHRRGVPLDLVQNAFVLAIARRTFRSDADPLEPIRSLQYFLPVVEELIHEPPLPEYLDYLKGKLDKAGVLAPA
jgi:hypothetical protein